MSELNPKARGLLQSMQYADEPTQGDYDRVHAALEARIAVGVAVGVAVSLGAESAAKGLVAAGAGVSAGGASAVAGAGASASAGAGLGAAAPVVASASGGVAAGAGAGLASVAAGAGAPSAVAAGGAVLAPMFVKVAAWVMVAGAVAAGTTAVARRESAKTEAPSSIVATAAVAHEPPNANASGAQGNQRRPRMDGVAPDDDPRDDKPRAAPPASAAPSEIAAVGSGAPPVATPRGARASSLADKSDLPTAAPVPVRSTSLSKAAPVAPTPQARESVEGDEPAVPSSPPSSPPSSIDAEIALLREAREALRGGSPDRALAVLDESARRFPSGVLSEDRSAERVFALCAAGRADEARPLAVAFLGDHPRSSYAPAVRASCATGSKN